MFGDLSAGSGLNALTRDEDFTRGFLERHQDKLLFGSDCSDHDGSGAKCQGSQTIAVIRRLAGEQGDRTQAAARKRAEAAETLSAKLCSAHRLGVPGQYAALNHNHWMTISLRPLAVAAALL